MRVLGRVKILSALLALAWMGILSPEGRAFSDSKIEAAPQTVDTGSVNSTGVPAPLQGVEIKGTPGKVLSIHSFKFKDEKGQDVTLGQYFKKDRPVLLTLVYYECANLCTFALNGTLDGLKSLDWSIGKEYDVVTVSINPEDTPELAAKKKANYLKSYGRPEAESGWHFLTSPDEAQVKALAAEVGFGYRYLPEEQQYAHAAGLFVLTPEGKLSQVLYGITYSKKDLKFAMVEASKGRMGTLMDRLVLFCYFYDPHARKYTLAVTRVVQAGGLGIVLILGGYLALFWRGQGQRKG